MTAKGMVFLVGAGPGDPGLLTLRAADLLRAADVVVYDSLVSDGVMRHARPDAERVFMGKRGGQPSASQDEINAKLIALARAGKRVVRLKGGDPYLFGRGAEEALVLHAADVAFEVVPGVTSAIAAPAYAGVPITHRDAASSVTFVTGHEDPTQPTSDLDFGALARSGTVVFLMGVRGARHNLAELAKAGRAPSTPACAVQWGTTERQRSVVGTIATLADDIEREKLGSPAILVVGDVVKFRDTLNWFERRPLFGRRIVVTRAREQASEFAEQLRIRGAEVLEFPTIGVAPPTDFGPLDAAIAHLADYDWIAFTSVNGVKFFFERLWERGSDVRALGRARLAAIGPKTAEALVGRGLRVDVTPSEFRGEALAVAFGDVAGQRILIPRALEAREALPDELSKKGARVEVVPAYRTDPGAFDTATLRDRMANRSVDAVTFTASSTVRNFVNAFGPGEAAALTKSCVVACIGPVTAESARDLGLAPTFVCDTYTIDALTNRLVEHFTKGPHS
ncbi:MAG: uroporphyrinogen-III C-methyltransferase [Deltaproteobacteria bacterium]|nr:uroporphyrinogen-III C-methyltransferase [Deltaproteobacteria bacterium]